jgi:hypothetical protein
MVSIPTTDHDEACYITLPPQFLRAGPERAQMREWLGSRLGRPGRAGGRWWTVEPDQLGFTWPEDAMEFRLRWL